MSKKKKRPAFFSGERKQDDAIALTEEKEKKGTRKGRHP